MSDRKPQFGNSAALLCYAVLGRYAMSHERKCWECGNVAMHESDVTPGVLCFICGSQDTRRTRKTAIGEGVFREQTRAEIIEEKVAVVIGAVLNQCPYWKLPGSTEPMWCEIRDAIMAKVFAIEHETGRQDQYAEHVRENCL